MQVAAVVLLDVLRTLTSGSRHSNTPQSLVWSVSSVVINAVCDNSSLFRSPVAVFPPTSNKPVANVFLFPRLIPENTVSCQGDVISNRLFYDSNIKQ